MKYICNPVNINYRYQIREDASGETAEAHRSAADPSLIEYHGRYYIFASSTLSFWVSDDLVHWESHLLPKDLPQYGAAPDVRVLNDYVYYCASARGPACDRYRTKDIANGPYERIPGTFDYWDPNLFVDDDGKVFFYWGSSNVTPIWGVELDPETMVPKGERVVLIEGHPFEIGFERFGEDNSIWPKTQEEGDALFEQALKDRGMTIEDIPVLERDIERAKMRNLPFLEGPWMDKHDGKYYLQYAVPATEHNVYSDGVYVSDKPLGPFVLAENNPYSYKPGGYFPGAGHGSTMEDHAGNFWHVSTMRISVNDLFERRVGLWPAGFDADGELFCNQRYGDWPLDVSGLEQDPWRDPKWMLLSSGKSVEASSYREGREPYKAVEENVQTWWQAAGNSRDEWLKVDLGKVYDVHAVQINFADDASVIPMPKDIAPWKQPRFIDDRELQTQWKLEASEDGETWFVVCDKSDAGTDLSHDFIVSEEGYAARYFRLSNIAVPYDLNPCISGLRVFGNGDGEAPKAPEFEVVRTNDLDMVVTIEPQEDTVGYNILFGSAEDKLYHSWMVFKPGSLRVGSLIKGRNYFVRVDAFNESGITEGTVLKQV